MLRGNQACHCVSTPDVPGLERILGRYWWDAGGWKNLSVVNLGTQGWKLQTWFSLSFWKVSKWSTCQTQYLPVLDQQTLNDFQNFNLSFGKVLVSKIFTCPPLSFPVPDRQTVCNFHPWHRSCTALLSGKGSVNRARLRIAHRLSVCPCVSCTTSHVYRDLSSDLSTCISSGDMPWLCLLAFLFSDMPPLDWGGGARSKIYYNPHGVPCFCCASVSAVIQLMWHIWFQQQPLLPHSNKAVLLLYISVKQSQTTMIYISLCQTLLTVRPVHYIKCNRAKWQRKSVHEKTRWL